MNSKDRGDPQPDRGKDNEHGHGQSGHGQNGGGRPQRPTTAAPLPSKVLTEIHFEFWHDITEQVRSKT